ncbi:MAG: substrate-binding domain-containing protein [Cyanobacteria bacterium J06621_3]
MKNRILATILVGGVLSSIASCSPAASESSRTDVTTVTTLNVGGSSEVTTLNVGGSSEAYEVLEQLAESYMYTTDSAEFAFYPPSQTSGGLQGVKTNTLDIGGVSRKLADAESKDGLRYVPLVEVPLVMVVHESVTGITDITADQIKAIYSGEISNWQEIGGPNAEINLFDLTEDENEKQVLRQTYLGETLEVTPKAIVFAEDDELVESASATDFSIAAVPLEDELSELPLTVLSIDGVEPSIENSQAGDYMMTLPLGMVVSPKPSPATESFIAFVTGEAGQQLLSDYEDEDDDD